MTTAATGVINGRDISDELRTLAVREPERVYATEGGRVVTIAALDELTEHVASQLAQAGVGPGARVAISLPNSVLHVATIFATVRLRALWIPVNTKLKGTPLEHMLDNSRATHLVAQERSGTAAAVASHRRRQHGLDLLPGICLWDEKAGDTAVVWRCDHGTDLPDSVFDTALVMYTSGTTGPPKGVQVSQTMWRAAALGAIAAGDVRRGDVLYLWEPMFHIGGAQMLLVPLYADARLALTRRFSASRFWSEVCESGATHVHYLGGILQILLQQPETPEERQHSVRVAWGAGATPALWEACRQRFRIALHECYGMTETSSIVTVNHQGPEHGIGTPLPWFEVRLDDASRAGHGQAGEILVRELLPGLLTAGYLDNEQATTASRDGEWFRTGDRGQWDRDGRLHFLGRASDSVRVRGENVSAWQVEDVFARHPLVERCAVVGVDASVGEQEIMLVLTVRDGHSVDPRAVVSWGADQLAHFQLPRYVKVVNQMPLTPSHRVAKHQLPTTLDAATDVTQTPP